MKWYFFFLIKASERKVGFSVKRSTANLRPSFGQKVGLLSTYTSSFKFFGLLVLNKILVLTYDPGNYFGRVTVTIRLFFFSDCFNQPKGFWKLPIFANLMFS